MDFTTIAAAVGALTGIGALVNSIANAKSAVSKATQVVEEVYGQVIKTLKAEVKELQAKVDKLEPARCDKIGCKNRIPPKQ